MDAYYPYISDEKPDMTALVLSIVVHLLFAGALFVGIQWKRQVSSTVMVEVWRPGPIGGSGGSGVAAVPAPVPAPVQQSTRPEPKPAPVESNLPTPARPDIAVRDIEKPKREKPPAPKREETRRNVPDRRTALLQELDRDLRNQQRAAQDSELGAAIASAQSAQTGARSGGGRTGTGTGTGIGGGSGPGTGTGGGSPGLLGYKDKIVGKIKGNIVLPQGIQGNPETVIEITQLPSGEILGVKLQKSSGNRLLDDAVERATLKSSPLPKPDKTSDFDRILVIRYKPFDAP